jgi:2,4-dienoyl-CoA reductase-like NADH-dependent reductase (Old Yellow Enzyme family)/thioredoxin reductase
MNKYYPHLFSPLKVRGKTLKNRIVSSPHSFGQNLVQAGEDGYSNFTETAAVAMGVLARGGAAVINTGHLGVDPRFYIGSNQEFFNFFSKKTLHHHQLAVMHMMTDYIHAYGALASIELNHGGLRGYPVQGNICFGPMDETLPDGRQAKALDKAGMDLIADYFAEAAMIGKRGGFDMINIHGAHNWLLGEFFSPLTNRREDEFGGNAENRARFPLMVLERIRERIGPDMLMSVRFSASELMPGGLTIEEAIQTVEMIGQYSDIVQCSAGKVSSFAGIVFVHPIQYMKHGCNTYLAREIRSRLKDGPFIETLGGINDPKMAESLVAEGACDLVAMARSFIADPDWAVKARDGRAEDIRPCIRCLRCLNFADPPHRGTSECSVNPRRLYPRELPPPETPFRAKKVAVVGGGPAGMEAAIDLAGMGHNVTLYEKQVLGGKLMFADHVVFKEDLKRYRDYLIHQVKKEKNISLKIGEEATPETIRREHYDALILAVGSKPFTPPISGTGNAIPVTDIFGHEEKIGNKVAIIGGGAVGCETAVHLQTLGKTVELVELRDELMPENKDLSEERELTIFYLTHKYSPDYKMLQEAPETGAVRIRLTTECMGIEKGGVRVKETGKPVEFISCDSVILAAGFRSDPGLAVAFEDSASLVLTAGDCRKPGTVFDTSRGGYWAALQV